MDPEGARLLTYSLYAYGKPRLPPVHKYSSVHFTAHQQQAAAVDAVLHAVRETCVSNLKSVALTVLHWSD